MKNPEPHYHLTLLFDRGVSVNLPSLLWNAAENGHMDIIRTLISRKCNKLLLTLEQKNTLLRSNLLHPQIREWLQNDMQLPPPHFEPVENKDLQRGLSSGDPNYLIYKSMYIRNFQQGYRAWGPLQLSKWWKFETLNPDMLYMFIKTDMLYGKNITVPEIRSSFPVKRLLALEVKEAHQKWTFVKCNNPSPILSFLIIAKMLKGTWKVE